MSKSASYSDPLTYVDLKILEHLRYFHAVTLFYKCMYNMGPINIKEVFLFRNNEYDLRGFNKLHQPIYNSRFMHRSYRYITSRLWNNLTDCVRSLPRAPSLNVFKSLLNNVNSITGVNAIVTFVHSLDFI